MNHCVHIFYIVHMYNVSQKIICTYVQMYTAQLMRFNDLNGLEYFLVNLDHFNFHLGVFIVFFYVLPS